MMLGSGAADLFLYANPHLLEAILRTTEVCEVHASEDIFDIGGIKLWSGGKPVGPHLIERLSNRRLRKPIELCIFCKDPVTVAGILDVMEGLIAENDAFRRLVTPQMDPVVRAIRSTTPNPTELLLVSVLRYGPRQRHSHAAAVTAISLALAAATGMGASALGRLVHAGMLHDIGELYMDPALFEGRLSPSTERQIMEHPMFGAHAVRELVKGGHDVAQAIGQSHERLNGSGYPQAISASGIGTLAQPLIVAEAIAGLLAHDPNGLGRASIATRLVPGEFPREFVNLIHARSRNSVFSEMLSVSARHSIVERLLWAQNAAQKVSEILRSDEGIVLSDEEQRLVDRVDDVLSVVRRSISATGAIESLSDDATRNDERASEEFEAEAVSHEVNYRLHRLSIELNGALERDRTPTGRVQFERAVALLDHPLLSRA